MASSRNSNSTSNPFNNFGFIIMGIALLVALYFAAKIAFNIIYWIAPILLIATLIIDYKVIVNYGKWLVSLFKSNPLYGIGAGLFTFFAYPIVSVFLFGKAMLNKKIKEVTQQFEQKKEGEYVEYEELPPTPTRKPKAEERKRIELPPVKQKQKEIQKDFGKYEDLFGE